MSSLFEVSNCSLNCTSGQLHLSGNSVINVEDYEENKFEYELEKRKWLVSNALSVILDEMIAYPLPEIISYARFNTKIPFEQIRIFSAEEYLLESKLSIIK